MATGSEDTSIKLLDVEKMKTYNQTKTEHGEDFAPARPAIRTFYDHTQASFARISTFLSNSVFFFFYLLF